MAVGDVQITEQSVCSRGCVCVCGWRILLYGSYWVNKVAKTYNPIHETSDDRYVMMVFVVRFDFLFHNLLVIYWRVTLYVDLEMMWMEVVTTNFIGCSYMFVYLNVEPRCLGFWPLVIIHVNIVVFTFCGQLWQIRIRSHGLQVMFLVSLAVAQITAFDEVRLLVCMLYRMRLSFSHCMYFMFTYLLTPWCRVLPEKLTGLQLVKKFPHFTEPEGSLSHSQASATCLCPGPAESSPYAHIPPGEPS